MLEQGSISNPYQLLIFVLVALAFIMLLFKIGNWIEAWEPKVKEKKKKTKNDSKSVSESKPKEEKPKEEKQKEEKPEKQAEEISDKKVVTDIKIIEPKVYSNYLYDRFVENPSKEDNGQKTVISTAFLSDNDYDAIRNREVKIKVNDVEDISTSNPDKDKLYRKIQEMANENIESKERLLSQFESLPREMKLLLIENIMKNM